MPLPFYNLGDCLRLPAHGDAEALVVLSAEGDVLERLTAIEVDARIDAVAARLQARGLTAGERVLLLGPNSLPYLLGCLALLRLGAVAVPLNPALPAATRSHVIKDAACRWCLCESEAAVGGGVACLSLDDAALFAPPSEAPAFARFQPGPEDLALVLYTSGSTGMPKGVPLTHHGQCWALSHYFADLESSAERHRIAIATPLYHMNGFFLATMALSNRMMVHLLPRFDAAGWLRVIAEQRINYVTGVPTMFALAAQLPQRPAAATFEHVTDAFLGSSPVTDTLVAQVKALFPRAHIRNSYGTTEAGPIVFRDHPQGLPRPPTSVGYPVDDIDWRFSDGSDTEGPLELRTPAVSPGYLNRPQATAKAFHDGWYRTGDIMRRDENGFFYFVGREDDMFVCGGENIYPGEVEALLERHPAIMQAAVLSMPHATKGQAPAAFVVAAPGEGLTEEAVKRFALEQGPAFAHPRRVFVLDALPLGGTRKVDRAALRQRLTAELDNEKAGIHG